MLNVIDLDSARSLARGIARPVRRAVRLETGSRETVGRIAAQDVVCPSDVPGFDRSTMDGFAVVAADTFGAGDSSPVELTVAGEVRMGSAPTFSIRPGYCARIATGGMLPEGADAVLPVEYTDCEFGTCLAYRPVSPDENVIRRGDDAAKGEVIVRAGTVLTAAHVGALAAAGICSIRAVDVPKVAVISTGDELIHPALPDEPGKVREVNSFMISAMLRARGFDVTNLGIVPDDEEELKLRMERAARESDIVLLSGGSSAGEKDLTAKVIASLGEVLAHGIAMKPGKPTVIGSIADTPVFGLPGNPAACYFVMRTVVTPCLDAICGTEAETKTAGAVLTENVSSNHGREEFVCVRLEDGRASPVYGKSGVITQLTTADGYIGIPRESEGLRAGESVTVYLF